MQSLSSGANDDFRRSISREVFHDTLMAAVSEYVARARVETRND
jgi:hypothetical protein